VTPNGATTEHDELRELLGVYALDALLPAERAALRAHLAECPECRAELAELQVAAASLPLLLDEIEPPPALRRRIEADLRADLAARSTAEATPVAPPVVPPAPPAPRPFVPAPTTVVRPEPLAPTPIRPAASRRPVLPWAAAAALLLAVSLGMLLWNLRLQQEVGQPEGQIVALVPGDAAPGADGEVRIDPEDDLLVLDVRDLPPLGPDEVYQVWLIGDDGQPVPSGVFDAPTARHAIAADPAAYDLLAITTEPGPLGSPGPTSDIVATAPLGG